MARRKEAHGGGHGWFVTFADLMGLLVSFFVMLVAFSTQDRRSCRWSQARCATPSACRTGSAIPASSRCDGLPTRPKLKNAAPIPPEEASANPTPDERGSQQTYGPKFDERRNFALAAASLRQAMQDMPEITELSKHIMIEETKEGLNIEIVDQDGRSMFPEGAKEPYERTRRLIERLAGPFKAMPYRISVTGHTSATRLPPQPGYGPWELSADRANAVRKSSRTRACRPHISYMVAGKADTQPLFPDDPLSRPIAA